MTHILGKTISELKALIDNKTLNKQELRDYFYKRIEQYNPQIHSYLTITEKTLKTNETADGGKLSGIPFSMKDTYNTKGIRTTAGSKVLENYISEYNATAYQKLLNEGGVLLGKSNCDAWGHGSSTENSDFKPTKNPWNREYVAGGSSGGSAASVAAYLTAFDIGEDTGGSIRLPANFCGTVGLKVTYGLVSRFGCIAYASSLDTVGPITRSVEDAAIVLETIAGNDPFDANSTTTKIPPYTASLSDDLKGLKIGIPKEYFAEGLDSEVATSIDTVINVYKKLGAEIKEISLPTTKYSISTYYLIATSETSSNLARYDGIRYGQKRDTFGAEAKRRIMLGTYTLSTGYYDAYYKKATQVRTLIKNDFESAFKEVDVIIAPVSPTPPFKIGEKNNNPLQMYLSDILTISINLAGVPALSVPSGLTKNGLPLGFQIIGKHFDEAKLLNVGYKYEKETNFYDMREIILKMYAD